MDVLIQQQRALLQYLSGHLLLSIFALSVGMTVSIPLGIYAFRNAKLEKYISAVVSVVQTIPSLALLALMVPLLGGVIGWKPALIALALYSMLPIVTNTITGLKEVDWRVIESGRAVGMTERQLLWNVMLPLAFPVIVAGIRTSVIWIVGAATLATPVGADSLGYYIFLGLNTRQTPVLLMGCCFAAFLAIILDRFIAGIEAALQKRAYHRAKGFLVCLLFLVISGIAAPYIQQWMPRNDKIMAVACEERQKERSLEGLKVCIGAKGGFSEQYILADLLKRHLNLAGVEVQLKTGLGSKTLFDTLASSTIDIYIDYTGTVWATVMKEQETVPPQEALIKVSSHLLENYGIVNLGVLGFENAYCFAMKHDKAKELGISSITDLSQVSDQLKIAGDFDFFGRIEGREVLKKYRLRFGQQRNMNSRLMYDAIDKGTVDVVTAYTSDGQIAAFDLKVLEDPLGAFPSYDAILLLSEHASKNLPLVKHLRKLVNLLDDDLMRWANKSVDLDGKNIEEVSQELYQRMNLSQ